MSASIMFKAGQFVGQGAALVVQGTALGASQFGQGAREGYVSMADELKAKRLALAMNKTVVAEVEVVEPTVQRQRRMRTATR